jgi:hypothetical protein
VPVATRTDHTVRNFAAADNLAGLGAGMWRRVIKKLGTLADQMGKIAPGKADEARLEYGYRIILLALWFVAVFSILIIVVYLVLTLAGKSAPHELYTVLSLFVGAVGTIVGFFFGHHSGASGKEKAENKRDEAEYKRDKAIAALIEISSERAKKILREEPEQGQSTSIDEQSNVDE